MTSYDRNQYGDLFWLVEDEYQHIQKRFVSRHLEDECKRTKKRFRRKHLFSNYTWDVVKTIVRESLKIKSVFLWFVALTLLALVVLVWLNEDKLVFNGMSSLFSSVIGFSGTIAALLIASFAFLTSQMRKELDGLSDNMTETMLCIVDDRTIDETQAKLWLLVRSVDEQGQPSNVAPIQESKELQKARTCVGRHSFTNGYLSELPVRTFVAIAPFLFLISLSLVLLPHSGETNDRLWGTWAPCAVIWLSLASIAFLASYLMTLFGNVSLRNEGRWRTSSRLGDNVVRPDFTCRVWMELAKQRDSIAKKQKGV